MEGCEICTLSPSIEWHWSLAPTFSHFADGFIQSDLQLGNT